MGPTTTLTYSLCTITEAEGIGRIEKLIGNDSSLEVVPLTKPVLSPFVVDSKLGEKDRSANSDPQTWSGQLFRDSNQKKQ